jgi:hypothetical protein
MSSPLCPAKQDYCHYNSIHKSLRVKKLIFNFGQLCVFTIKITKPGSLLSHQCIVKLLKQFAMLFGYSFVPLIRCYNQTQIINTLFHTLLHKFQKTVKHKFSPKLSIYRTLFNHACILLVMAIYKLLR